MNSLLIYYDWLNSYKKSFFLFIILFVFPFRFSILLAQNKISEYKIISTDSLQNYLKNDVKKALAKNGKISQAQLAEYFRKKFSERYYYNWQNFSNRFVQYNQLYSQQVPDEKNAADLMRKFAASTQWLLPFNYLNGGQVNAYALRHLARQHKMVDVAFQYFYSQGNQKYIDYFVKQMRSLNAALENGKYEKTKNGNGIYENFRAGTRIFNWLSVHNMFLGQKAYTNNDQLITIATLLQHGEYLYEHNAKFMFGNHQTRGMSALAVLSILLRDFKGTGLWYNRAMTRLQEHLTKEVNADGFQSERSIHYHMSDIDNYFYVYQLAKRNKIEVSKIWKNKLYSMFIVLAKIAFPDKTAPVLQDDTDNPWAERTDISGTMALGYLLFKDPTIGYFANDKVNAQFYWFLSGKQINQLSSIQRKKPTYGSMELPDTKYYIMRQGWDKNDQMMVISAGLNKDKPDHQQGDMLGVQAVAYGHVILPNYQVRYSLTDYELFKNSLVKNVALVDNELQGREYTSNKGGSGFGKFKILPQPTTILWQTNKNFDIFIGSHNGFNNIGVNYFRQVIYVKNYFWIIKDNFQSEKPYVYKQVWQGHYTREKYPNLLQSDFADATGCDILQLHDISDIHCYGTRGKQWTIETKDSEKNFSFITVIYPFKGYSNSISVTEKGDNPNLNGWVVNQMPFTANGKTLEVISKKNKSYLFDVENIKINNIQVFFLHKTDVFVEIQNKGFTIHALGYQPVLVSISGADDIYLNNKTIGKEIILKPGNILKCQD